MIKKESDTWEDGFKVLKEKDAKEFLEFRDRLQELGIRVCVTFALSRKDSHYGLRSHGESKTMPCLFLYAADTETYQKFLGEPFNMEMLEKGAAEKVIAIWREICVKYGYDVNDFFDEEMFLFFYNMQRVLMDHFVRESKDEAERFVVKRTGKKPKDVYVSSRPSFNIVFEDEATYRKAEKNFDRAEKDIKWMIYECVREYLDEVDDILEVNFWYPGKPGYNGYGFARQD